MAYLLDLQPESRTIRARLTDEIVFEETIVGNQYAGPRGTYSAPHWPSDVYVYKHPEQNIYTLSADWELPRSVQGGYSRLDNAHGAVASKLSGKALDGFKYSDSDKSEPLFPAPRESKPSSVSGGPKQVNEFVRNGLNVREHWKRHTVTAEVWSELGDLPGSVIVTKDSGEQFYSVSAAFPLPDSLNGLHSSLEQVLQVLQREIARGFFAKQ